MNSAHFHRTLDYVVYQNIEYQTHVFFLDLNSAMPNFKKTFTFRFQIPKNQKFPKIGSFSILRNLNKPSAAAYLSMLIW